LNSSVANSAFAGAGQIATNAIIRLDMPLGSPS
jgi:hypothetical protein